MHSRDSGQPNLELLVLRMVHRAPGDAVLPSWWLPFCLRPVATPLTCLLLLATIILSLPFVAASLPVDWLRPDRSESLRLFDGEDFRWPLLWQLLTAPLVQSSWVGLFVVVVSWFYARIAEFNLGSLRLLLLLWCSQAVIVLLAQVFNESGGPPRWALEIPFWALAMMAAVDSLWPGGRAIRFIRQGLLALIVVIGCFATDMPSDRRNFIMLCSAAQFGVGYAFGFSYPYLRVNRLQRLEADRVIKAAAKWRQRRLERKHRKQ